MGRLRVTSGCHFHKRTACATAASTQATRVHGPAGANTHSAKASAVTASVPSSNRRDEQIYLGRVARIAARLDRRVELQQSPALSHRLQLWSRLKNLNFPDSDNSPIAVKVRLREYFLCLFNILFLFQANIPRVAPTIEPAVLIVQVNLRRTAEARGLSS